MATKASVDVAVLSAGITPRHEAGPAVLVGVVEHLWDVDRTMARNIGMVRRLTDQYSALQAPVFRPSGERIKLTLGRGHPAVVVNSAEGLACVSPVVTLAAAALLAAPLETSRANSSREAV